MYKIKHALIHYCLIPFQSCITLNCQYIVTYCKDHSNYFDGVRPTLICLAPTGRYENNP